jgi:hypothetical protein
MFPAREFYEVMLLIHCPACRGTLEVEAAQLMRPRRICCTLCAHRWVEDAKSTPGSMTWPSDPLPPQAEPEPAAATSAAIGQSLPATAEEPSPKPKNFGRKRHTAPQPQTVPQPRSYILVWSLAVMSIVTILIAGRETVVRSWPPSAQAFAAVGLPVNLQGLEIRDVRTRIVQEPTQKVLTIDGEIRNLREGSQTLPELLLSLRDAQGREVYAWKAPPPKSGLARGETIQFRARLAAPPDGANLVRVQFAEPAARRIATR